MFSSYYIWKRYYGIEWFIFRFGNYFFNVVKEIDIICKIFSPYVYNQELWLSF